MAIVRAFKGVRATAASAKYVCSLPYDVMNREEAAKMAEGNPRSFLHICRSEIDMDKDISQYDASVYEKAGENLRRFIDEGVLVQERQPVFYIYKQVFRGRSQVGIVATVSVDEYEDNIIKKHELTRAEKEQDRINHFDIVNANTEPVFLTYRKSERDEDIKEVMGRAMNEEPIFDFVGADGVEHALWTVSDDRDIMAITRNFDSIANLYIADGHHRSASAYKVGLKRRQSNPNYSGNEEFNFFMAVIFPERELEIMDYNRVVKDLNGLSEEEFLKRVEQAGFKVTSHGEQLYNPKDKHEFSMYLMGRWYSLIAGDDIIPQDPVESLDAAILQKNLLEPILEIGDPRVDKRIDFIGGIRGLEELERRVNDDMKVAFALYPVSMEDLLNVADAGKVMPPKSTWFEPKLGSGLFIHLL